MKNSTPGLIIENLSVALIVFNHDCIAQLVNISAETLLCQSRKTLLGKSLQEIIPVEPVISRALDCIENNSQYTLREIGIQNPNDETLVDITLSSVIYGGESEPWLLVEINSINRISRFMKESNQLERQMSFRSMMRGLAHEIKNPLGGIRGAAQLLDRESIGDSNSQLTQILIKEADRLTRLVDRVMGSREQLKQSKVNIHELLEHVIHLSSVDAEQNINVKRIYDPALPEIELDKEQLIQALLNIVGNAIEAQLGQLDQTIGLITKFERLVTINQVMFRQVLKISVWDAGPGVPDEIKDSLFDPLITGRPSGTGLGLSITQEIIQRHNGVVVLEEYEGNTCFSIYLPYIDPVN